MVDKQLKHILTKNEVLKIKMKGDKRPRDHQNPRSLNKDATDMTNIIDWSKEV